MLSRLAAGAQRYALAGIVIGGVPVLGYFLLGVPEFDLPSRWADGRLPAGYIADLIAGLLLLAWIGGLALLAAMLFRRDTAGSNMEAALAGADDFDPVVTAEAGGMGAAEGAESDEPWYRQGPPLFDEPFRDDYPRVVVPPDDAPPDESPVEPAWPEGAVAADAGFAPEAPPPVPTAGSGIPVSENVGGPAAAPADGPPMIVPVRAYYFTRAEDTLRSIAAQFLQTPKRWDELRGLNAASPGVAGTGPDTLLPVGTALALPGDPLPWGKPDPVYLWTLAEKFLFAAWGREPTPEEVVPFWRGLTSGQQPGPGDMPAPPQLAAPPAAVPAAPTGSAPEHAGPAGIADRQGSPETTIAARAAADASTASGDEQPPAPTAADEPESPTHEPSSTDGEATTAPPDEPATGPDLPTAPGYDPLSDFPAPPGYEAPEEPHAPAAGPGFEPAPGYDPLSDFPAPPGYEAPEEPHAPAAGPGFEPAPGYDPLSDFPAPPGYEAPEEPHAPAAGPGFEPAPGYDPLSDFPAPPGYEAPEEPHAPAAGPGFEPAPGYDPRTAAAHRPPRAGGGPRTRRA